MTTPLLAINQLGIAFRQGGVQQQVVSDLSLQAAASGCAITLAARSERQGAPVRNAMRF